jgi:hypothetical protein
MDYVVREYLVHSGYQEAFNSMDVDDAVIHNKQDFENINNLDYSQISFRKEHSNLSWRKESQEFINYEGGHNHHNNHNNIDIPEDYHDRVRKYSDNNHNEGLKEPELRKRTLSIMMDRIKGNNLFNIDDKKHDIFVIMNFLEERKIIQNMIKEKDYATALIYFETNFQEHIAKNELLAKKIILCLKCLQYFDKLRLNDYQAAYQILNSFDMTYWVNEVSILLYDKEDRITDYTLEVLN